jgi:heptaprenyl diphosphate synthase
VVDDVLDVVATDDQLGKPAGHDIAEGVYNLPVLRALADDGDELRSLLGGPIGGADLDRARALVRASVGVEQSIEVARRYAAEAVEVLAPFGERPATTALAGAAGHLLVELDAIVGAAR